MIVYRNESSNLYYEFMQGQPQLELVCGEVIDGNPRWDIIKTHNAHKM